MNLEPLRELEAVAAEMRERRVNHGKFTSPTLEAWANRISRAIAQLDDGWRPIEEAPMDGTSVLVWPPTWGSKDAAIAKFYDDRYAKKPRPYWKRDDDLGQVTRSRSNPPTHFRPLPSPPAQEPQP